MEKIKYNISLDIQGIVPFRVEEGALEDLNNFKKLLKKYIQRTLRCEVTIKECEITCLEK